MSNYKAVKIEKGSQGWGGPLIIKPTEKKNKIASVTGGGIHPLAQYIADLTGAEAIDAFSTGVPDEEMAVVIVDCGGTARCGVYPKKGVYTINLNAVGAAGPLAQYIKEEIYVSDVKENNVTLYEGEVSDEEPSAVTQEVKPSSSQNNGPEQKGLVGVIAKIGKAVGGVVNKFFAAGRDAIDTTIRNILPFMAFVSMLLGIISASGIGDVIAKAISPLAGSLPGMIVLSIICAIPFLSPVLGPGAVIAQVVGVLVGAEIAKGTIPPTYALPALFAIDAQVGADFVPVGLSLGEAEPSTVEIGVPAMLFSRLITGPIAVIIAYFCSFGLY
ncbi:PTS glucitol/sorbitol transporter subunit IIB [Anaerofustis sp. NSJ-163]|uniref:PTS glucitol/sorbitol transporter subunit IIB n=1 Tax=Anaerofustis sp. NSJ-163 TaxID=2944391 RepID=UPI00209C2FAD|nr:PTS glucitol/sorbitol transporter subunit IIB [Anaerofustis sp. NSJ-163]MCO8193383.1 PTS glucitol/sorbitol transporter subunit IIB [Anaerofustis sp. NSJ-163]